MFAIEYQGIEIVDFIEEIDRKDKLMPTVTLEEAQAHLPDLIAQLQPGSPLLITQQEKTVARLIAEEKPPRHPRKAGNCKGMIVIIEDDDEHLRDFAEYME